MNQWFDCHLPGALVSVYFAAERRELLWLSPTTRQSASIEAELLSLTSISYKFNQTLSHWSVIEHRTRKQDIEVGNYMAQTLENMADLHGES